MSFWKRTVHIRNKIKSEVVSLAMYEWEIDFRIKIKTLVLYNVLHKILYIFINFLRKELINLIVFSKSEDSTFRV